MLELILRKVTLTREGVKNLVRICQQRWGLGGGWGGFVCTEMTAKSRCFSYRYPVVYIMFITLRTILEISTSFVRSVD